MKISIIMPAYNAEHTICEALESVRIQSCRDWELIVVDDGSTDGTVRQIVKSGIWKEGDKSQESGVIDKHPTIQQLDNPVISPACTPVPIRIVRMERNCGPAAARNAGAHIAHGEWLAFLDADDSWLPGKLEIQMQAIRECHDAVMVCGVAHTLSQHSPSGIPRSTMLPLSAFAIANPVATSTVLLRRDVFDEAGGFDEQFRGPEDYDLWMRVAARGIVLKLETPLATYRHRDGSLSVDDRKFLPQVMRVIEKAYGQGGVFGTKGKGCKRKAMAWQHLSACWMAANRRAAGRATWLFVRSLAWWPRSFRSEREIPWGRIKLLVFIIRRCLGCREKI